MRMLYAWFLIRSKIMQLFFIVRRMLYARLHLIIFLTFMIYNPQILCFIHQKLVCKELQEKNPNENPHPPHPTMCLAPTASSKPAKSGGGKQKKWSKGKQKEKVNNTVIFDQATYDKLLTKVPKYKQIMPSVLSERLKVTHPHPPSLLRICSSCLLTFVRIEVSGW